MIAEFGVDPEVLAEWRHFRELWPDFGIEHHRQIALYPKKWKRVTIERAQSLIQEGINTDIQLAKMIERLSGEGSKAKFRKTNCADWQDAGWLVNAQNHQPAFDAIISTTAAVNGKVLVAGEFLRDEAPYAREKNFQVNRTASELVAIAWPLLESCREIILVEPNFDPTAKRFIDPLIELIELLQRRGIVPVRFELHTCKPKCGIQVLSKNYQSYVERHLPEKWSLDVCFWAEIQPHHQLHPRFILTEIGGLHYDYGLDTGDPGTTTLVTGLGDVSHRNFLALYSANGADFSSEKQNEKLTIGG